ncbi:MAG: YceI family protein [Phototrophicales bacterium]
MAKWQIDVAHSTVGFAVKHMVFTTVRGSFKEFSGVIDFDVNNKAASSVDVTIQTASIDTRVADRDAHLRSADFFNVEKYPTMTFKSTHVELQGDNVAKVTGDLTIAGVTKPVTLDVTYLGENVNPWGKKVIGFEASTQINREDFGLTWNQVLETGGFLVSKEVKIELEIQATPIEETEKAQAV